MDIVPGNIGLSIRMNKVHTFDGLVEVSRSTVKSEPDTQNKGWLGQPYIFRVPTIMYKEDEDGGQKPVISVTNFNMYQLIFASDNKPVLIFETNPNTSNFFIVEKLVDRKERAGLKLSFGTIILDKKDNIAIKNQDIMMSLWCTDDVEGMMSGYLSMYNMKSLYIGSLRHSKERDKG